MGKLHLVKKTNQETFLEWALIRIFTLNEWIYFPIPQELVQGSFACRDLVDEAKKYHLRPECRVEMQNQRTRARMGSGQVLYVLGGFGNLQTPVDVVERYDSKTNQSVIVQVVRYFFKTVSKLIENS